MQRFNVQGMTCGHCVKSVTQAIKNDDPTADVQVDLASGVVQVESALTAQRVSELIREEGYEVQVA
jgi:copper chaperone